MDIQTEYRLDNICDNKTKTPISDVMTPNTSDNQNNILDFYL